MSVPIVGSLVVPAPIYRESMETGEGAAILLDVRRSSGHLFYPGTDREFWVPTRQIGGIPPDAVPEGSQEDYLSKLLLFLDTEACALVEYDTETATLEITYPGMDRAKLLELITMLGDTLDDYVIRPGSMQVALLELTLKSLPPPAFSA